MVRLDIDVLWEVVRFSVRVVISICKVEGDVEGVHDFSVGLYSNLEPVVLEVSSNVFPDSFRLWS